MAKWNQWQLSSAPTDKPDLDLTGTWRNELGSVMSLRQSGDKLEGTYTTKVGAADHDRHFKLRGVVNGDLVSFSVSWEDIGSITTWAGQHALSHNGAEQDLIKTTWVLVKNVGEDLEPQGLWAQSLVGQDVFRKIT